MTIPSDDRVKLISDGLRQFSSLVQQQGNGSWEFSLANGAAESAQASIRDEWLTLSVPFQGFGDAAAQWSLLHRNGTLPGLCKFALDYNCLPQLRADLPLDWEQQPCSLRRRLAEAAEGMRSAVKWLHGSAGVDDPGTAEDHGIRESSSDCKPDLGRLLDEAGWPSVAGPGNRHSVQLEVRNGYSKVFVSYQNGADVVAHAELAKWEVLAPIQREALGIFLLTACGTIRMVRATVVETEARVTARFEVRLSLPSAGELAHALAALSVAANICTREALSLGDERIARMYFAARKVL